MRISGKRFLLNPMPLISTCQLKKEWAEGKGGGMAFPPAQIFSLLDGYFWGYIGEDFFLPWLGGLQAAGEGEKKESFMKPEIVETAWAKEMKKKVEVEMARRELETVFYWRGEMEKILVKRPESLAAFQIEVRNLLQRMQNRIGVLKSSLPG
jgi:hypothetical protein